MQETSFIPSISSRSNRSNNYGPHCVSLSQVIPSYYKSNGKDSCSTSIPRWNEEVLGEILIRSTTSGKWPANVGRTPCIASPRQPVQVSFASRKQRGYS